MDSKQSRKKQFILIAAAVFVALAVATGFLANRPEPHGTVTVTTNLADNDGLVVTYNDTRAGNGETHTLAPGSYTVKVEKAGYTPFSTKFTLRANDELIVNAQLRPASIPTVNSLQDIGIAEDFDIGGATITNREYFYDQTWAVLTVSYQGERDAVVVQYDVENHTWHTVAGPAIFFTADEIAAYPPLIQNYLTDNNFVGQED